MYVYFCTFVPRGAGRPVCLPASLQKPVVSRSPSSWPIVTRSSAVCTQGPLNSQQRLCSQICSTSRTATPSARTSLSTDGVDLSREGLLKLVRRGVSPERSTISQGLLHHEEIHKAVVVLSLTQGVIGLRGFRSLSPVYPIAGSPESKKYARVLQYVVNLYSDDRIRPLVASRQKCSGSPNAKFARFRPSAQLRLRPGPLSPAPQRSQRARCGVERRS